MSPTYIEDCYFFKECQIKEYFFLNEKFSILLLQNITPKYNDKGQARFLKRDGRHKKKDFSIGLKELGRTQKADPVIGLEIPMRARV